MAGHGGKRQGAGRKKGVKDRVTLTVKDNILLVCDKLTGEKMGLLDEARKDPKWFYTNFYKMLIPRESGQEEGLPPEEQTPVNITIGVIDGRAASE